MLGSRSSLLAAQAGVRYAAENPHVYVDTNVVGFLHILEGCHHHGVEHLVFASTNSVYGANLAMPFSEHQPTEHPLALYAASKKESLGKKAIMQILPLQAGDVPDTEADVSALIENVGYRPVVSVEEGVGRFADWYRAYHQPSN